jgi:acyl-CoA reductase-like NAD-dependent aldehyde dehydrogenase
MNTSELWIGGKEHKPSSGEYFDDLNPSNADLIARVAKGNMADVNAAVADAKNTFEHFKDSEVRTKRENTLRRGIDS